MTASQPGGATNGPGSPLADPAISPPHPLSLWSEYAKTIVGLATGVLAVLATFATSYIDRARAATPWASGALIAACVLLLGAIWCSIFVAGGLIGQARADVTKKDSPNRIAAYSNISFLLLFGGMISLFSFLSIIQFASGRNDATTALNLAEDIGAKNCKYLRSTNLKSMTFDEAKSQWMITLQTQCALSGNGQPQQWTILVTEGKITSIESP
jgi:hypothetical protein